MKKITVQFATDHSPYRKGEIATFFERQANRLIDRGIAIYAAGDDRRSNDGARLKNLSRPPETRHIPGPAETRENTTSATFHGSGAKGPSKVEGAANTRKCGECGKPGHTRANCPNKK